MNEMNKNKKPENQAKPIQSKFYRSMRNNEKKIPKRSKNEINGTTELFLLRTTLLHRCVYIFNVTMEK